VQILAIVFLSDIVSTNREVRGAFAGVAASLGCAVAENLYSIWFRFRSRMRVAARR
jgi:RsiW-degrading membrane proteinase PrsW (M82 family)